MSPQDQYEAFLKYYDYKVPNPEHNPIVFKYLVTIWKLYGMKK